jgi:outer membrane protein assembly factor BamA
MRVSRSAGFQIDGNTILTVERIQALVAPYVGKGKVYGDVQKALEALEGEYRRLGYGTVQVYVPEQELTGGQVRLVVSEGVVGKVTITGNKYFNEENVRAALPELKEGTPPNMRKLSENMQLSNENPAKQVEVTLGRQRRRRQGQCPDRCQGRRSRPLLCHAGQHRYPIQRLCASGLFLPELQHVQQGPGADTWPTPPQSTLRAA